MNNQPNNITDVIDVDMVINEDKKRCFFHTIKFNVIMWLHQLTFKLAIIKSKFKRKA